MFQRILFISLVFIFSLLVVDEAPLSPIPVSNEIISVPVKKLSYAEILLDQEDRISDEFSIPPELIPRVSFWFDIYTIYGFQHRVIHHQDYPWWIYEVVDVQDLLVAPSRAKWLNIEKAQKESKSRLALARDTLKSLTRKIKKNKELNEEEIALLKKVELLPGNLKTNLAQLPERLRIQTGQKDFFFDGLKKSTRYLEFMEKIFADHGLPKELTRLPLVESSFNEDAGSKVGALGIWQLMPPISRKFIMVSDEIDERKSPYKATYVAARLFRENFKILKGEWPLVVTAYNHGPGGLIRAKNTLKTSQMSEIIKHYKSGSFGFASENFYCEFLAALTAQSYSDIVFDGFDGKQFTHVDHLQLPRRIRSRELLALSQLSAEEFLSFNPDLKKAFRQNLRLPKGLVVFLPTEQINVVLEGLEKQMRVAQK